MKKLYRIATNNGNTYVSGVNNFYNTIKFLTEEHCCPRVIKKVEAVLAPRTLCYTKYRDYFEKHEHEKKEVKDAFKLIHTTYKPAGVGTNDIYFSCRVNFRLLSVSYNLDLAYVTIEDYATKDLYHFDDTEQDFRLFKECKGFKRCKDLYEVVEILCAEPEKILSVLRYLDLDRN